MTMISRSIILAIVILLMISPTYAATPFRSVEDLYRMCETPITSPEHAVCLGYISAVGDLLQSLSAHERLHAEVEPLEMCGSPTYGALVEAFVGWSKENPRQRASHRMEGVMQALMEHWPCK